MKRLVIKLGGKLLTRENLDCFTPLLSRFIKKTHTQVCLVHGGGETIDSWLSIHGFSTQKKQGLRCTPDEHMPIVRGALSGFCNTELTGALFKHDLSAVGLTLADACMTRVIQNQNYASLGKVAEIKENDISFLDNLMLEGKVPVISSIAHDPDQGWFNINADQAAIAIASAVDATELWLLSDVDGVMDSNGHIISCIYIKKNGPLSLPDAVKGGMHIKLLSAASLARNSSCEVLIGNGQSVTTLNSFFNSFPASDKPSAFRRRCGTQIRIA